MLAQQRPLAAVLAKNTNMPITWNGLILERYRQEIIQQVEWYVRPMMQQPAAGAEQHAREMIAAAGRRPFRCKPYFQPGCGVDSLKENAAGAGRFPLWIPPGGF